MASELPESILDGADNELTSLAARVRKAWKLDQRRTVQLVELKKRLKDNDASRNLKAANDRLKSDLVDYRLALGAFMNGDPVTGLEIAAKIDPSASRFAELVLHNPASVIAAITERANARKQFIYDAHGHRVRSDLVNEHNECPECQRESIRK